MYTMILAAALSAGPDAPGFGCGCGLFGLRCRPCGGLFGGGLFGGRLFARCRAKNAVWVPPGEGVPPGFAPPPPGPIGPVPVPPIAGPGGPVPMSGPGGPVPGGPVPMPGPGGVPVSGQTPFPDQFGFPPHGYGEAPMTYGYAAPQQAPVYYTVPSNNIPQGYGPPPVYQSPAAPAVQGYQPPATSGYSPTPMPPMAPSNTVPNTPYSPSSPQQMPSSPPSIPPATTGGSAGVPNRLPTVTRAVAVVEPEGEAAPARLVLEVPAGATVTVDGIAVGGSGTRRKFHTPDLPRGRTFYYQFRVEAEVNGHKEVEEKLVAVCAGDELFQGFAQLTASR